MADLEIREDATLANQAAARTTAPRQLEDAPRAHHDHHDHAEGVHRLTASNNVCAWAGLMR